MEKGAAMRWTSIAKNLWVALILWTITFIVLAIADYITVTISKDYDLFHLLKPYVVSEIAKKWTFSIISLPSLLYLSYQWSHTALGRLLAGMLIFSIAAGGTYIVFVYMHR